MLSGQSDHNSCFLPVLSSTIDFIWTFSVLDFCTRLINDTSKPSHISDCNKLSQKPEEYCATQGRCTVVHPPVSVYQSARGHFGMLWLWCGEAEWDEWPWSHRRDWGWGLKRTKAVWHIFLFIHHESTNRHIQLNSGKTKSGDNCYLVAMNVILNYQLPWCALTCTKGFLGSPVRLQFSICFSISPSFSAVFRANSTSAASCSSPEKNTFTSFL